MKTQIKPHVMIIGGGIVGCMTAMELVDHGCRVTIVERNPHILPLLDDDMARHLQNQVRRDEFQLKAGVSARAFTECGVEFDNGETLPADLILLSVGVQAEVELAKNAGRKARRGSRAA